MSRAHSWEPVRLVTHTIEQRPYLKSVAHLVELFYRDHCLSCPEARAVVQRFAAARRDIVVIEHNIDDDVRLATEYRLIATPALVIDRHAVMYGVPRLDTLAARVGAASAAGQKICRRILRLVAAHSKLWYLQQFRLLDAMTEPQKRMVEKMTRMLEIKRGQRVYMPGDPSDQIFLLKAGVVKISSIASDQQETILAFLYPGDIFGELAMVEDSPRDHLATAHENVVLCALSRELLVKMAHETPALGYHITKIMGLRLRRFRTRIEELLCKSAQARIAHTLLDLAGDYGIPDNEGILIPLRLNQADLGSLVGLARETVNIVLQDFKQRGLVDAGRRNIRIIDPARLRCVS